MAQVRLDHTIIVQINDRSAVQVDGAPPGNW